jgi:hypothetical protein
MLTVEQLNALGSIINYTFGKSTSKAGDRSVTASIQGDTLIIKFISVVQFASDTNLRDQSDRIAEESIKIIADAVSSMKKDFKEATGTPLKLSEESSSDNVEVVTGSIHSPRRIAYYRRTHTLKIKE